MAGPSRISSRNRGHSASRADRGKALAPSSAQTRSRAHAAKKKVKSKHICSAGFEEIPSGSSEAEFQLPTKWFRVKHKKPKIPVHKKDFLYY